MKLFFAFGTRPEAIKMAPLIKESHKRGHQVVIGLSGQHKEMVEPFLQFFELEPHYNLEVMASGQSLELLTSKCLLGYSEIFEQDRPDYVFVQGDTTTAMTGAMAAFYKKIPVAHIEAGLRTGDMYSPFPEEVNRKLICQMTHSHYCPTLKNKDALALENITKNVFITGNTSIDALDFTLKKMGPTPGTEFIQNQAVANFDFNSRRTILVTAHRRENHGQGLINIFETINKLTQQFDDIQFLFPVHLNPNVIELAQNYLKDNKQVVLTDPLSYTEFVYAMNNSYFIMSDSGGVQEEAPHLGRPVLVLRESTERQEAIDSGCALLVGTDKEKIYQESLKLLEDKTHYQTMASAKNPYGDATAATKTIEQVEKLTLS